MQSDFNFVVMHLLCTWYFDSHRFSPILLVGSVMRLLLLKPKCFICNMWVIVVVVMTPVLTITKLALLCQHVIAL